MTIKVEYIIYVQPCPLINILEVAGKAFIVGNKEAVPFDHPNVKLLTGELITKSKQVIIQNERGPHKDKNMGEIHESYHRYKSF